MQAVVSGLITTYSTAGKGKDVLLLHGWGDNHQTFARLGAELAKSFRVTAVDLPGFGQTAAPDEVWGLEEYARFVAHFVDKIGLKPYALVGHSNGGSVAIVSIANGLVQPAKLILLASAGIRDRQKLRRLGLKIIAKVGKAVTFWLPDRHKRKLQTMLYGAAGSDMNVAPHLQETFKLTVRQDVQADARKLNLPTLLLYGSDDKATPPLYGHVYNKLIKGSQLQVLESAGHFIHHDRREEVSKRVEDFLK